MPDASQFASLFGWFALAAVAGLAGFYVIVAVRRWAQRDDPPVSFTIQDLRDMLARGEITDAEFAAMRLRLLTRAQADLDDSSKSSSSDGSSTSSH